MVTYNHENYIKKAVESVLMQKTNFKYELVIGEDCSTDKTRGILFELKEKHLNTIRLLLRNQNLGAMENSYQTYKECKGEYIAILEGDDYWADPYKLQLQVDFLDNNIDYVACCHNTKRIFENSDHSSHLMVPDNIEDFDLAMDSGINVHISSLMFREDIKFPKFVMKLKIGDWPKMMICISQGKVRYLHKVMSVYRDWKGEEGSQIINHWLGRHSSRISKNYFLDRCIDITETAIIFNKYYNYQYEDYFNKVISDHSLIVLNRSLRMFDLYTFFKQLITLLRLKNYVNVRDIWLAITNAIIVLLKNKLSRKKKL